MNLDLKIIKSFLTNLNRKLEVFISLFGIKNISKFTSEYFSYQFRKKKIKFDI